MHGQHYYFLCKQILFNWLGKFVLGFPAGFDKQALHLKTCLFNKKFTKLNRRLQRKFRFFQSTILLPEVADRLAASKICITIML